ncbi:hypothetical protein ACEN9J_36510 [Variovorax sp. Varisp41]|uniref:hypothetical protein n=1 Tax=Variovorax sp. Varisp41 TaxID=3243033 RepID=UPI0039B46CA5
MATAPTKAAAPWNADSVAAHRRAAGLVALDPALCGEVAAILEDLHMGLREMPGRAWFALVPPSTETGHVHR